MAGIFKEKEEVNIRVNIVNIRAKRQKRIVNFLLVEFSDFIFVSSKFLSR